MSRCTWTEQESGLRNWVGLEEEWQVALDCWQGRQEGQTHSLMSAYLAEHREKTLTAG